MNNQSFLNSNYSVTQSITENWKTLIRAMKLRVAPTPRAQGTVRDRTIFM